MFYLIYLLSSLIFLCNYSYSNEDVNKISWICGNEKCDVAISDIVTTNNLKVSDHKNKLTYLSGEKGRIFKKPLDGSDFWYAEINGKQGYVHKNFVRETSLNIPKPEYKVDEDNPFSYQSYSNDKVETIKPSHPSVYDGTTIDSFFNEIESDSSLPSSNNDVTPPLNSNNLNENFKDTKESTQPDGVDINSNIKSDEVVGSNNIDFNNKSLDEAYPRNDSPNSDGQSGFVGPQNANINPIDYDTSGRSSINSNAGSIGVGSLEPIDDEEEDIEDDETDEATDDLETDSLQSKITNTDSNLGDQVNFNADNNETVATNSVNDIPGQSEQLTDNFDNSEKLVNIDSMDEPKPILTTPEDVYPDNNATLLNVNQESAENITDSDDSLQPSGKLSAAPDLYSNPQVHPLSPTEMHAQLTSEETNETTLTHIPSQESNEEIDDKIPLDPYSTEKGLNKNDDLNQPSFPENVGSGLDDPSVSGTDSSYNVKQSSYDSKVDPDSSISSHEAYSNISKDSTFSNSSSISSQKSEDHALHNDKDNLSQLTPSDDHSQMDSVKEIQDFQPKYEGSEKVANVDDVRFDPIASHIARPIDGIKSTSDESKQGPQFTDQSITSSDETVSADKDDIQFSYNTLSKEESEKIPPNRDELTTQSPVYESPSDSYPVTTLSPDLHDPASEVNNVQKSDDATDVPLIAEIAIEEDSSNFYSSIASFFGYFKDLFSKSELPSELKDSSTVEDIEQSEINTKPPSAPLGYCYEGESCSGLERPIGGEDQPDSFYKHYKNVDLFKETAPLSYNSILYICITSVVILIFSLGYYYIDKRQNSSYLIEKVNKLSQELFLTKKERDTLEDQLLKIKENCNIMDSSKMKQDSKLTTMQSALEESERAREQLEETVVRLEKEVETLMEQGMEMHKLLSETLSDEERSQMLLANIDELRESLSEKLNEIVTLTNQLDKKNEEIQLLQIDVRTANDRISEQDRRLESCKTETEETFTKKLHDHQQQIIKLQQVMEEKGVTIAKLENELAKTKVERDSAESRASSAEAGLQAAHSVGAGEARKAWLDSTSIRAELANANKTNETLQQSLSATNTNNKLLQEKINSLTEEISSLNSKYENVEKEKVNALTKLQVLSDYFKEKESKLQEELGVKESQWLQKETEDHTIYEQMKSLREEISSYKSQNDKLKAEILEQEASYKVQIANEEQKSYDNWVALRQAERKVKELQMESAHFRNRLTQLEAANQSITDGLNPNGLDKGSFSAPSPPFMMLPPLPSSDFFPLPPPPIHPSASRPPPLGRISSPQLSGEMLPPPPLVSFDMLPPATTPPPSLPMYKPQPRERPPPKDSPPSNYSSESINEKSARRRRR